MTALLLLALTPVAMWVCQSTLLLMHGLPVRMRLDAKHAPRSVRTTGRIVTQVCLAGVVVAYPFLKGQDPVAYYADLMPERHAAVDLVQGFSAAVLYLGILFAAFIISGRMVVELHESRRRLRRH